MARWKDRSCIYLYPWRVREPRRLRQDGRIQSVEESCVARELEFAAHRYPPRRLKSQKPILVNGDDLILAHAPTHCEVDCIACPGSPMHSATCARFTSRRAGAQAPISLRMTGWADKAIDRCSALNHGVITAESPDLPMGMRDPVKMHGDPKPLGISQEELKDLVGGEACRG